MDKVYCKKCGIKLYEVDLNLQCDSTVTIRITCNVCQTVSEINVQEYEFY